MAPPPLTSFLFVRLQTAIAASVDLRCYGLTAPRKDGVVALRFSDLGDFYHEWVLDDLPWDAATSVDLGDEHPENLDQKLVDALIEQSMPETIVANPKAKAAAVAFLYLYMVTALGGHRWVHSL